MSTFSAAKDPNSVEDFTINWASILDDDTIDSSSWTADSGVVVGVTSNTTTTATAWVSGGTRGSYCSLVNTVITAGGRTYQRTIVLTLRDL